MPGGSVIFPKRGASILLNKVRILESDSFMDTNMMALTTSSSLNNEYLYYYLTHIGLWRFADTTSIPQINNKHINPLLIPIPPPIEQRAIAAALSDVDALLAKLDQLIAKKRDLKQATMQQLLTGRTRLPGFSDGLKYKQTEVGPLPEDWEVKFLPEVSWFQEGPGLRKWQFTTRGIKVINITNLEDGYLNLDRTERHISKDELERTYKHFLIDAGDIVVASSGNSYCKVAVVRDQDLPLVMNTSVIRFKPLEPLLDYKYLLVFLRSPWFKKQIDLLITGGAQPNFGPFHLKKILIQQPPLAEQTAIATILSDMDADIAALEARRDKTQRLKQGMMQELLTGRIRLV